MNETAAVRNNVETSRYELGSGDTLCIAAYDRRAGALAFTHTEVPAAMAGQGMASRLIKEALADVRASNLKVIPLCAFVAAYFERHPEEQDLLATDAPG